MAKRQLHAKECRGKTRQLGHGEAKKKKSQQRSAKQAPALSPKCWRAWLNFVKGNAGPRMFLLIWLTGAFGLRCGEAVALRRQDLALDAEEPYVRAAGHVEGAKKSPGHVFVSRSILGFLKRVLSKGLSLTREVKTKHGTFTKKETFVPPPAGFLFRARAGTQQRHLPSTTASRSWRPCSWRASKLRALRMMPSWQS